jgi:hypothetical protein
MEFENLDLKFKTLKINIEILRSSRNPYQILANYRNMPPGSDSCTPYPTVQVNRNMPPNDVIEQCLIVQACSFLYTHLTAVEVKNAHRTIQLHCNTNERPTPLQDSEFPVSRYERYLFQSQPSIFVVSHTEWDQKCFKTMISVELWQKRQAASQEPVLFHTSCLSDELDVTGSGTANGIKI